MHGYVSSMQIHLHLNKQLSGDHTIQNQQKLPYALANDVREGDM